MKAPNVRVTGAPEGAEREASLTWGKIWEIKYRRVTDFPIY